MKQQPKESGAIISDNFITLGKRLDNNRKRRKYYILIILLSFTLFSLMWVYVKWQKVPTKNHYFLAEYITSSDSAKIMHAAIDLAIPKEYDLVDHHSFTTFNRVRFFLERSKEDNALAIPLNSYSKDSISNYVGQTITNEIATLCSRKKINTEMSEIFLFRHYDNEKKADTIKAHGIIRTDLSNKDYMEFIERNSNVLTDYQREKKLGILNFGYEFNNSISDTSDFSPRIATNVYTTYYITQPHDSYFFNDLACNDVETSKFWGVLKMEDISQTNYKIHIRSKTILELIVRMSFCGSIECANTNGRSRVYSNLRSPNDKMTVGNNYIELLKKGKRDYRITFRVRFNDMQNAQRMRLFVLTAIITIVFTTLLKLIWKVAFESFLMRQKNKFDETISAQKTYTKLNNGQETDDDIPGFYL